jgi:hypothetical protein
MALTKVSYSMISGAVANVVDYGADATGATTSVAAVQAAIDSGAKTIYFPPGTYLLPAGAQTVQQYGVAQGDSAIDIPSAYAVMIGNKTQVTIDASQANFVTDDASVFVFYRAVDCRFIGGRFTRTGSDGDVATNEASAVVITRSADTVAKSVSVDSFYRNLFAYRAPNCGFFDCVSVNAIYFNYYCASTVDITIGNYAANSLTRQYAKNCLAKGGTFGNYFGDQAIYTNNQSFNLTGVLGNGIHFTTEYGQLNISNNFISEATVCNGSNNFIGISIAPALSTGATTKDCVVENNIVLGNALGIFVTGAEQFSVVGNYTKNYYATGISVVTQTSGGLNYDVKSGTVDCNVIANINDASTRTAVNNIKICGLQFEENNGLVFSDVICSGNMVDAKGANTTKTPDYGVYVEATRNSVQFAGNSFATNVPSGFPSWGWGERRTLYRVETITTGTGASPTTISEATHYDGSLLLGSGANARLLTAEIGMRLTISATTGTCYVYVNGASTSATGTDYIYCAGKTATQKNLEFTGPGCLQLICVAANTWMALPSEGTVITLTP